jgi:uncharacterized membrane protein YedE/YeeE
MVGILFIPDGYRNRTKYIAMLDWILEPWPWYVGGPLIGLMVPLLLFTGNKSFGISSSLRHVCASVLPTTKIEYFNYDWKKEAWNLFFAGGMILGGLLAALFLMKDQDVALAENTVRDLKALGITDFSGLMPTEIFSWQALTTGRGLLMIVLGGFLVGFGTRYAGGCTSGHAIMGLSNLSLGSLVAVIGFFIGGLLMTYVGYPLLF